jgi:hypothetical protein
VIRILTWLWRQPIARTKYTSEHVNIWAAMVRRNLTMPHELACVTNMSKGIDPSIRIITPPGDFEGLQTPRWRAGRPNCYRRLAMFRRDAASVFGERFVCMDLDCVIGGPLDPLFDRPDDFVVFNGTAEGRPYNGSMMMLRAGCRPQVYEKFSETGAIESGRKFVGSDQAWLAYILGPNEKTWSEADGAYFWGPSYRRQSRKVAPTVLFFPGKMKPWLIAHAPIDRFVHANYRLEMKEAA